VKGPYVVFKGKAIIDVDGYVINTGELRSLLFPSVHPHSWKGCLRIDGVLHWSRTRTKKEAVAWVKSSLPKTLIKNKKQHGKRILTNN